MCAAVGVTLREGEALVRGGEGVGVGQGEGLPLCISVGVGGGEGVGGVEGEGGGERVAGRCGVAEGATTVALGVRLPGSEARPQAVVLTLGLWEADAAQERVPGCVPVPVALAKFVALPMALLLCETLPLVERVPLVEERGEGDRESDPDADGVEDSDATNCDARALPETLSEGDTESDPDADAGRSEAVAPDCEAPALALLPLVLVTEEVVLLEMESVPVREGVEVPLCVMLGLRLRVSVELTEREKVGEAEKEDDPEVLGLEEEDALEQPEAEPDWRADREAETEPVSL